MELHIFASLFDLNIQTIHIKDQVGKGRCGNIAPGGEILPEFVDMKKILMKRLLFLSFAFLLVHVSMAQEVWSLERCVQHALDTSLAIQQSRLMVESTELTGKSFRHQRFPTLNASTGFGINFGRVINPATNLFETENSLFQSASISSGVNLYSGFQLTNSIRQNRLDQQASNADLRQAQNDLALNVALTYLNVLFAYENLSNAELTRTLTRQQLDQLDRFIAAGTRPENERYDILAQLAADDQNLINVQNTVDNNLLALKQLLLLEPSYPLEVEVPDIGLDDIEALENLEMEAVYGAALNTQPLIESSEFRLKSAEKGVDIARGQMMPSLTLGGSIGTNWSDLARQVNGFNAMRVTQPGVYINGDPVTFEVEQLTPSFEQTPYLDQVDNNLGYGFSLNLRIPIYNNYQARIGVERAELDILRVQNENEQIRQTLKTDIQNAITAARAGKKTLIAAEKSLEASQIAYDNAVKRFEVGVINSFELIDAQNRLEAAKVSMTIAKYDYIFRILVIEYYLGRGFRLD